jgi:hypothetical protein
VSKDDIPFGIEQRVIEFTVFGSFSGKAPRERNYEQSNTGATLARRSSVRKLAAGETNVSEMRWPKNP